MSVDLLLQNQPLALFLDVDGTLLEIAATPDAVRVPAHLPQLLYQLWTRSDGAVALISGRHIADLDSLFAPHMFPAAGVHGCERRDASGCIHTPEIDRAAIDELYENLAAFAHDLPGVLVEHKQFGVAIHYRLAPEAQQQVRKQVQSVMLNLGADFVLQRGKCVYEIKPAGYSKGGAVRAFMESQPFRDRYPVFIGDDVTDEDGFAEVNSLSGMSICVGAERPTLASHRIPGVREVHQLLANLAAEEVLSDGLQIGQAS